MTNRLLTLVISAAFLGVTGIAGLIIAAEWPEDLAPEIVISDPVYKGKHKKGPVKLPHKKHIVENELECQACHHDYQDGENVWQSTDPVKKCSECHPYEKNKGKLFKMKMGTAYHNKCRKCHKQNKKGPTECKGCHLKPEEV